MSSLKPKKKKKKSQHILIAYVYYNTQHEIYHIYVTSQTYKGRILYYENRIIK